MKRCWGGGEAKRFFLVIVYLFVGFVSIFKIFSLWGMMQGLRADMRGLGIELGCMKWNSQWSNKEVINKNEKKKNKKIGSVSKSQMEKNRGRYQKPSLLVHTQCSEPTHTYVHIYIHNVQLMRFWDSSLCSLYLKYNPVQCLIFHSCECSI